MAYAIIISGLFLAIFFSIASQSEPGFLRRTLPFIDLLKEVHPCEMCPDCQVLRSLRSKHCAICKRCVERFDHHCPWLNNCVGVNNHNSYLAFLYFLSLFLILSVASAVLSIMDPDEVSDDHVLAAFCLGNFCMQKEVRIPVCGVDILLSLLTLLLPLHLVYVHTGNYATNKTTIERYGRNARRTKSTDSSDGATTLYSVQSVRKGKCCGNCRMMCWPGTGLPDQSVLLA